VVTFCSWTAVVEFYGKACNYRGHQKDMCSDEIGVCAQNINTIVGLVVNTTGRADVITLRERELHYDLI
jgi:hypothetical protein